jgi:hypothetical protein
MKKLLGLLSAASLIATTGASVVSCGFVSRTSNSDDTNGNDKKDDWSKSLNRVITETYLGNLAEKQYKDKDFILNKTLEKNPGLDINELVVTNNGLKWGQQYRQRKVQKFIQEIRASYHINFDRDYTELKWRNHKSRFRTYFKQFKRLHFSKN